MWQSHAEEQRGWHWGQTPSHNHRPEARDRGKERKGRASAATGRRRKPRSAVVVYLCVPHRPNCFVLPHRSGYDNAPDQASQCEKSPQVYVLRVADRAARLLPSERAESWYTRYQVASKNRISHVPHCQFRVSRVLSTARVCAHCVCRALICSAFFCLLSYACCVLRVSLCLSLLSPCPSLVSLACVLPCPYAARFQGGSLVPCSGRWFLSMLTAVGDMDMEYSAFLAPAAAQEK